MAEPEKAVGGENWCSKMADTAKNLSLAWASLIFVTVATCNCAVSYYFLGKYASLSFLLADVLLLLCWLAYARRITVGLRSGDEAEATKPTAILVFCGAGLLASVLVMASVTRDIDGVTGATNSYSVRFRLLCPALMSAAALFFLLALTCVKHRAPLWILLALNAAGTVYVGHEVYTTRALTLDFFQDQVTLNSTYVNQEQIEKLAFTHSAFFYDLDDFHEWTADHKGGRWSGYPLQPQSKLHGLRSTPGSAIFFMFLLVDLALMECLVTVCLEKTGQAWRPKARDGQQHPLEKTVFYGATGAFGLAALLAGIGLQYLVCHISLVEYLSGKVQFLRLTMFSACGCGIFAMSLAIDVKADCSTLRKLCTLTLSVFLVIFALGSFRSLREIEEAFEVQRSRVEGSSCRGNGTDPAKVCYYWDQWDYMYQDPNPDPIGGVFICLERDRICDGAADLRHGVYSCDEDNKLHFDFKTNSLGDTYKDYKWAGGYDYDWGGDERTCDDAFPAVKEVTWAAVVTAMASGIGVAAATSLGWIIERIRQDDGEDEKNEKSGVET